MRPRGSGSGYNVPDNLTSVPLSARSFSPFQKDNQRFHFPYNFPFLPFSRKKKFSDRDSTSRQRNPKKWPNETMDVLLFTLLSFPIT